MKPGQELCILILLQENKASNLISRKTRRQNRKIHKHKHERSEFLSLTNKLFLQEKRVVKLHTVMSMSKTWGVKY